MAFEKRTWLARIGTGLNKFIIGNKDSEGKQTLTNAPDLPLTQEGDVISAENLNDLEERIEAGLNEKQNTLTFDDVPTSGSNNPVKSGGVYTALAGRIENFSSSISVPATSQGKIGYASLSLQISEGYSAIAIRSFTFLIPSGTNAYNVSIAGIDISTTEAKFAFIANESVPSTTGIARVELLCQKTS